MRDGEPSPVPRFPLAGLLATAAVTLLAFGVLAWRHPGGVLLGVSLLSVCWGAAFYHLHRWRQAMEEQQAACATALGAVAPSRSPAAKPEWAARQDQLEQLIQERSQALLEGQQQVLQKEKLAAVGQLAAGIAHEINTPIQYIGDNLRALSDFFADLTALLGQYQELVELTASGGVPAERVEAVRTAAQEVDLPYIVEDAPKAIRQGLEGVERVAHIVRAMKDFSHVDRGEACLTDLNQCLQSTLTVARNEYKYVADVETHFGDLPPVRCYAGELNQVFLNIMVNAAHAIADTGRRGRITITTRVDGEDVEVCIADTGTGIPEAVRPRIFEPFFTTKEVNKGTGQGLYLAHQIVVQRHGGTLQFETVAGQGTTFYVRIPVRMELGEGPETRSVDGEEAHSVRR